MKKILLLFILFSGTLHAQPPIAPPDDLVVCDQDGDGVEIFDLTFTLTQLYNGLDPALYTEGFYTSLQDAQNEVNLITDPTTYINISNPQTIYVRVFENANPSNFEITDFDLVVGEQLEFTIDIWQTAVCEMDSPQPWFYEVSGTPNSTVFYSINGGAAQSFVLDENGNYNHSSTYIFYENELLDFCFTEIVSNTFPFCSKSLLDNPGCMPITIIAQPELIQPSNLVISESSFDGIATFDLTVIEDNLISDENIYPIETISYYHGNQLIENPNSYENLSNNQTIRVVVASDTGCVSEVTFNLIVMDADIVFIPDANFKTKLLQANTSNGIAKDMNGVNIIVDINADNEIQVTEALSVFRLNVFNSAIVSMEGIASFSNLQQLGCSNNLITEIDISTLQNLTVITAYDNPLVMLDCNNNSNIEYIGIQSSTLQYLLIKNGVDENLTMDSGSWFELFCCNPNLEYVCCDESQFNSVMEMIQQFNLVNCEVNTYCNFTPGGNYNTVTGNVHYDANSNGCDESDFSVPFFRLMIDLNSVSTNSSVFTNSTGVYTFYTTNEGEYSFTPSIENPSFFDVNPQPGIATIDEINNATTNLDFCISANGVHPDLEIVVAPIIPARPGFEAKYLIVYKNKGNQIMSQEYGVNFFYNQQVMNFVSSSVVPSSQLSGGLQWSFENLMPFESRSIEVTMAINPPTDTENPINIGDELIFTSIILPQAGDENVQDNTFVYNQTVVGSYDPNDITCIQGDVVPPSEIGNYLHYLIRFENTGNAPAENIVVKVDVDPNQFDYNSLQVLATSNNATVRMNSNVVEFIFQNIQLESGGHGNILLKMKTNETLQIGDYVEKRANIYFDYNFPVETNEAETLFDALSIDNPVLDNLITIYPNPVKDIVNVTIKNDSTIKTIELYDIQGRLLQTQLVNDITSELDLSSRTNGMYFIKINTDKGSKVEKLIKE